LSHLYVNFPAYKSDLESILKSGTSGDFQNLLIALAKGDREIGRAHVWTSSHANISYAVFCL